MKKELWETLVLEVIAIDSADIITTSGGREPGEGEMD